MLASCFSNFKTCKSLFTLKHYHEIYDYDSETIRLHQDEISKLFMDSLIVNSFILHIFKIN
ncbi:hypothetical protein MXB_87 [Myxobolus squamalis]|nr:hypothetical protein MXB_87 [Myxobolus squamalis]